MTKQARRQSVTTRSPLLEQGECQSESGKRRIATPRSCRTLWDVRKGHESQARSWTTQMRNRSLRHLVHEAMQNSLYLYIGQHVMNTENVATVLGAANGAKLSLLASSSPTMTPPPPSCQSRHQRRVASRHAVHDDARPGVRVAIQQPA